MKGLYIFSAILILLIVLFVWYYFGGQIGELKKAKKEFEIPGLADYFVPQGISYLACYKKILISGYMSDGKPSRVYVIDKESGKTERFVNLKLPSGALYFGHAGGIATNCNDCYVSSEGKVFHFFASDIFSSAVGVVDVADVFETKNGADFCFIHEDTLYVGEFYKLAKFKTDLTHHVECGEKKYNHSLVFGYKLKEHAEFGLESVIPCKAISVPDMVQGVVVAGNKIFVSKSYGIARSEISEYKNILTEKTQTYVYFDEKQVPLWILSDKNLQKTRFMPEMAEEIELIDNRIFIVFESATIKYKFVTRTRLNHVFSLEK